ncbi:MAG: alpha/beta fold hydrolase [Cytophagaceae bacterium]
MNTIKRNNVNILGKGKQAVMFAHGFGCDQNMWRFVYPAFEDNYKVILFDHVGAGKSDSLSYDSDKYSSLNGYAQDVLEICKELKLSDVIFVGHSVSAMIGILASIKSPEYFSQLILVGPSPCYINDGEYKGGFNRADIEGLLDSMDNNYLGWARSITPVIMGNPDRPELSLELGNSFCATDPEIAQEFARVTFLSDNRKDITKCRVPSLILQCSEDVIAPREVGEYMHRLMPESTLKILQATGHCPNLSAPEETIEAIKVYLETQKELVG